MRMMVLFDVSDFYAYLEFNKSNLDENTLPKGVEIFEMGEVPKNFTVDDAQDDEMKM